MLWMLPPPYFVALNSLLDDFSFSHKLCNTIANSSAFPELQRLHPSEHSLSRLSVLDKLVKLAHNHPSLHFHSYTTLGFLSMNNRGHLLLQSCV